MDTGREAEDREWKENGQCSERSAQGTGRAFKKGRGETNELLKEVTS